MSRKLKIDTRKALIGYEAEYVSGAGFYIPWGQRKRYGVSREHATRRLQAAVAYEIRMEAERLASTRRTEVEV